MLHILVVDDDPIILEALCHMIQNISSLPQSISLYQASNGLEALNIVRAHPVDIIFTDIKMPLCTGLELMNKLNTWKYQGKIIVVSGFDDYHFIRSSIKLGASDYLLKPVKSDELEYVLKECVTAIGTPIKPNVLYSQEQVKELQNTILTQENCIKTFLTNTYTRDTFFSGDTPVFLFLLDIIQQHCITSEDIQLIFLQMKDWIESLYGDCIELYQGVYNDYYTLVLPHFPTHTHDIQKFALMLTSKNIAFQATYQPVPFNEIINKYLELLQLTNKNFYKFTIPYDYLHKAHSHEKIIKSITTCISTYNYPAFLEELNQLFYYLCSETPSVDETKKHLTNIIYNLLSENTHFISVISNHKFKSTDLIHCIQIANSAQEMYEKMSEIIKLYIKEVQSKLSQSDTYHIQKAKALIEQHYAENLSLSYISNTLGIHPNYLSSLFKTHTGNTFSQYIRKVRINHAKNLIKNSNLKMYEIADQVGYHDHTHFYRMFKEETGISPAQYKQVL